MDKIKAFLDGKKTYIAAIVTAGFGLYGVTEPAAAGTTENIVTLVGLVVGSISTLAARYVSKPVAVVKKRAKRKVKKVVVTPNA